MQTARKDRGFTLIELLVVIAIIAILAAILFPIIRGAMEKARQATCMGNLMQINTMLASYYADYGRYPFEPYYLSGQNWYIGGVSALYPDYISDKKLLVCPDDHMVRNAAGKPDNYSTYNGIIVGGGNWDFNTVTVAGNNQRAVVYNNLGYDNLGWEDGYLSNGWWVPVWPDSNGAPTWLASKGKKLRSYPRLMNPHAGHNTISTHCWAHRNFYNGSLAGQELNTTGSTNWRDLVVTLGGHAQSVNWQQYCVIAYQGSPSASEWRWQE